MGAFDSIVNNKGQPPAQSPKEGAFSSIVSNKPPAPQKSSTNVFNSIAPAPSARSPYFYGTTPGGGTIGKSDELDTSGKPFLGYRNPGDTATTTDKTRMATTFDPRVPQKLDLKTFLTSRMSDGASAKLKQEMAGSYSDELDHVIALELAGSNDKSNLQIQKGRIGGSAKASDNLENTLAKQVTSGKISLQQAHIEIAQNKGLPIPKFLQSDIPGINKPLSADQQEQYNTIPIPEGVKPGETFKAPNGRTYQVRVPTTQEIADNLYQAAGGQKLTVAPLSTVTQNSTEQKSEGEQQSLAAGYKSAYGHIKNAISQGYDALGEASLEAANNPKQTAKITGKATIELGRSAGESFWNFFNDLGTAMLQPSTLAGAQPKIGAHLSHIVEKGYEPASFAGNVIGTTATYMLGNEVIKPITAALEASSPLIRIAGTSIINTGLPALIQQVGPLRKGETQSSRFLSGLPGDIAFGLTSLIPNRPLSAFATGLSQFGIGAAQGADPMHNALQSTVLTIMGFAGSKLGDKNKPVDVNAMRHRANDILATDLGPNPHPQDLAVKEMAREYLRSNPTDQKTFIEQAQAFIQQIVDKHNSIENKQGGSIRNPFGTEEDQPENQPYFHGADAETAANIKANGFQPSKDFPGYGMVNLTNDPEIANHYANLNSNEGEVLRPIVDATPETTKVYDSMTEYENAMEAQLGTGAEKEVNLNKPYDLVIIKNADGHGKDMILGQPDKTSLPPTPEQSFSAQAKYKNLDALQEADTVHNKYWNDVVAPQIGKGKTIEIGGDNMKEHFGKDYAPDRSNLYSKAAYDTVKNLIKDPAIKDVTFLSGGPGSGKTEFLGKNIKAANSTDLLYDNSFTDEAGLRHLIDLARSNGKEIHVAGVIADRERAREFTKVREKATGRPVSEERFNAAHVENIDTLYKFLKDGTLKPEDVTLFDLRGVTTEEGARAKITDGDVVKDPLATLEEIRYNDKNGKDTSKETIAPRTESERPQDAAGSERSREIPQNERPDQSQRTDYQEINKGNREYNRVVNKEATKAEGPRRLPIDEKIDNLRARISATEDKIKDHQAKPLEKFYNPRTGQLAEVTGEGKGFSKTGDDLASQAGYPSSEAGREGVLDLKASRKQLEGLKKELADARTERTRMSAEDKDAKSLNYLLNKTASKTDIEHARQDRLTEIKKAEAEGAERARQEEKDRTTLQDRIKKAQLEYSGRRGIIKKILSALSPSKYLDPVSKPIIEDWFQKTINAKQSGLEAFDWAIKQGPQNFQEIVDFQAGKQTSYIKEWFDSEGTDFKRRGLNFNWRDNYMPDVWKDSPKRQAEARKQYMKQQGMSDEEISNYIRGEPIPEDKALRLKLRPNFSKERFWPDYVTGMEHGLNPKFQTPADLIGYYKEAGERAIANIELIRELKGQARLLTSDDAPDSWEPVTLRFSKEGLYAPPALAELLNGKFRDEGNLKIYQSVPKAIAATSRFLQDLVLSGGVPGTNINAFSAAQAYRLATTAFGDVATLRFRETLTNLKLGFAFIRSNSNALSAEWFETKSGTLTMMARNGIDLTDRIGGRNYKTLYGAISDALRTEPGVKGKLGGILDVSKIIFNKAISEKTFKSLMPQIKVTVFEGAYKEGLRQGLSPELAEQFAAETTKAAEGITPETGRSKTTKDTLSSALFAPPYREGLVRIFTNASKGFSTEFNNPAYLRNRNFIVGLGVTYLLYNAINKQLNGNYLWDNPPGRELALRVPRSNGDVFYIELGPGILTVPRNLFLGTSALAKGDIDTAKQKYGSVLSMPLQIASQVWANKDYYGNPIWSKIDSQGTILKKIAAYVGLETSHPYVAQIYKYAIGKQPLYWSLINMAEIPVKLTNLAKEQQSKYYDTLQQKQLDQARAKEKIMPIYQKNQDLKNTGQGDKATEIYNNLNKSDKAIYDLIKKDEKTKDTNKRKAVVQGVYDNLQKMKAEGRVDEANKIYFGLSPEDQHVYDLIRKATQKSAKMSQ